MFSFLNTAATFINKYMIWIMLGVLVTMTATIFGLGLAVDFYKHKAKILENSNELCFESSELSIKESKESAEFKIVRTIFMEQVKNDKDVDFDVINDHLNGVRASLRSAKVGD